MTDYELRIDRERHGNVKICESGDLENDEFSKQIRTSATECTNILKGLSEHPDARIKYRRTIRTS